MGIDISKPSLHKLETGNRILKDYELFGLSMVFKVPIQEFISDFIDDLKNENISITTKKLQKINLKFFIINFYIINHLV